MRRLNSVDTRTISICSGYGGIELSLRAVVPGIRTVCYVENEVSVCEILGARIKDGLLDDAPIWTDLRTFDATAWRGRVHLITGGFPCQPHSVAGNRKGADDSRELSGEVLRIAEELGYPTLYLENVPGIRKFWYYNVRPRLQSMGYRVEEVLVTAAETGAPHKRQRLFILAHHGYSELSGWLQDAEGSIREPRSQLTSQGSSLGNSHTGLDHDEREALRTGRDSTDTASLKVGDSDNSGSLTPGCGTHRDRQEENQARHGQPFAEPARPSLNVAHNERVGAQVQAERKHTGKQVGGNHVTASIPLYPPGPDDTRGWESVYSEVPSLIPTFCRVAYGPTPWLDQRLRAIGNGVVPASAARAWQILSRRFLDE